VNPAGLNSPVSFSEMNKAAHAEVIADIVALTERSD
jgi:hypothetical protein